MKFYDREPFDDQKVEGIRIQLQNLYTSGRPNDYQVYLDDLEVVPRTNDVSQFTSFYDLIGHTCKNLIINVFSGATRHKRTYSFYFPESGVKQGQALGGVDAEQMIDHRVARATLEIENKHLSAKNKELMDTVLELQDDNQTLVKKNNELNADLQKVMGANGMATTIMGGVERIVSQYFPGKNAGKELAGTTQPNSAPAEQPGMVSIPIKQYDNFQNFSVMANQFTQEEFNNVMRIVGYFTEDKASINETISFLFEEAENNSQNPNQQ